MKELLKELNINLTDKEAKAFKLYYEFLLSENKKHNLTRIISQDEVIIKHFYDSLTLLSAFEFKDGVSVADIGSGAGFPGITLAIMKPHINVTLVEANTKKTTFLNNLIKLLELTNVFVINERAEVFAENNKERFEVVTARAVAPLNILNELALPLVKVGGTFLAMKAENYLEELKLAKNGIIELGGTYNNAINFHLPLQLGKRTIIIINKSESVNKYPRPYNQIKKNPL